ncbi:MAG: hypothetical protein J6L02_08150 [Bacteroidales bacterium]|nr:hypothetical protein [Bacteroidales bacterium]
MNKKFYLPLLFAIVIAIAGCKMGDISSENFSVNPNPLEVVGGKVDATITGVFPEKYFKKKVTVTVTPYLVYAEGETAGTPFVYQGEKIVGNNQEISYKLGGTITMPVSFDYVPAMKKSELWLGFEVTNKKGTKTYSLERIKVADGIIATAELADVNKVKPAIAADAFQRIINETCNADIMFLIQQANIRSKQLKSEEMEALKAKVNETKSDDRKELKGIEISSYASPDGGYELNYKLAEKREDNTMSYLNKQLKKDTIATEVTGKFTAQDWDGFKTLVEKSNIQDKELILRVLSMYNDPAQREKEIKNMSSTFKVLAEEILPQLRYSRITASIDLIGKSDEEIMALVATDPKELSLEEILYAGTLTSDKDQQLYIYAKAAEYFPNDYRAFNNAGMVCFEMGNFSDANAWFEKAAKISANSAQVQMNQGLIALKEGNQDKAAQCFGNAAALEETKEATGVLYLEKGDYQKAVKAFGESKTNNAALAQILVKDYAKAQSTLDAVANPDAMTFYLKAVIGARTNNESNLSKNLRQAVSIDESLKAAAATDIEFANYDITGIIAE